MRVFLAGGTGFVGTHLLDALLEAGHQPKLLIRHGSEEKLATSNIEICYGDALDPKSLSSAIKGSDAIINLIGIIKENPKKGITFPVLHYEATRNLVNAAVAAGIKRFLQMSANGASVNGATPYQTTKWAAEEYLKTSDLEWTIFRPSVIFGDPRGKTEMVTELANLIRSTPLIPIFGDGEYRLQPVSVLDVSSAFVTALTNRNSIGKTYTLCGPNAHSYKVILDIIGRAIKRIKVRKIYIPLWLVQPMVSAIEKLSFAPITRDQLTMLIEGNTCDDHSAWGELGIQPIIFSEDNLKYLMRTG